MANRLPTTQASGRDLGGAGIDFRFENRKMARIGVPEISDFKANAQAYLQNAFAARQESSTVENGVSTQSRSRQVNE